MRRRETGKEGMARKEEGRDSKGKKVQLEKRKGGTRIGKEGMARKGKRGRERFAKERSKG